MKNFSNLECVRENYKSLLRSEVYCILPTYLSMSLFFILCLLGLEFWREWHSSCNLRNVLPSAWDTIPTCLLPGLSISCSTVTPQLKFHFLQKVFNRMSLMSCSPNFRVGYLYLSFALLSSIFPISCDLSHRIIIIHTFPT